MSNCQSIKIYFAHWCLQGLIVTYEQTKPLRVGGFQK